MLSALVLVLAAFPADSSNQETSVAVRVSQAVSAMEAGRTGVPQLEEELRLLPQEETIDALVAMIRTETYVPTAYYLLSQLHGAEYPRGLEALLAGLESQEPTIRDSASRGLMHTPDEKHGPVQAAVVAALVRETSAQARQMQLQTLSRIGRPGSAEDAAPVIEVLRSDGATDNERSSAAQALLPMLGWRSALEQFRSTASTGRFGLLAILMTDPERQSVDAERDLAYRAFALEQLGSPLSEARRHGLQLISRFFQGAEGATPATRAANLELRAAFVRRLEHETERDLKRGLEFYCQVIDAEGNLHRLLPTSGQPTPHP
jgi:hypothetical protein